MAVLLAAGEYGTLCAMSATEHTGVHICPYCQQAVSSYMADRTCLHCHQPIFDVPCPQCHRKTLNLTLLARYGTVRCFACRAEYAGLPLERTQPAPTPAKPIPAVLARPQLHPAPETMPVARGPKAPIVPNAEQARKQVEEHLVGLERAGQDREMLRAPELRIIVNQMLDDVHDLLALDDEMNAEGITPALVRDLQRLSRLARCCYAPLLPSAVVHLPLYAQAWAFIVDDAVRRWQLVRRRQLADELGLQMMLVLPDVTRFDPQRHECDGDAEAGVVIDEVLEPGFTLNDRVLCKAFIRPATRR